jgi:aryl carrier-like protein
MEFTEAEKIRWKWHRLVHHLTSGNALHVEFKEQFVIMGVESLVRGLTHVETKREYGVSLQTATYYRTLCMKNWSVVYPLYKELVRVGDERVLGGV